MSTTRLTIRLETKLRQKLQQLARKKGQRPSQLVREALEAYCNGTQEEITCYDIAMKAGFIGSAKHAPTDLSTNPRHMKGFWEILMEAILVDAGPLVALASRRDAYHERCLAEFQGLRPPLVTTWPVLAEVDWLLRDEPDSRRGLYRLGEQGLYRLPEIGQEALPWLAGFLGRYSSIRPQLADATLVYLAEREGIAKVFTLDRGDFSVYRFARNKGFTIIPE